MAKCSSADTWFSRCVRERAEWKCEYCKREFAHDTHVLDCSHFYGRRARRVRFDGDNAFAHCRGCHNRLGENPGLFTSWAVRTRGQGWFDILTEKWNDTARKITKQEERQIAKHYKQEYETMQKKRNEGKTGWLEFVNYD